MTQPVPVGRLVRPTHPNRLDALTSAQKAGHVHLLRLFKRDDELSRPRTSAPHLLKNKLGGSMVRFVYRQNCFFYYSFRLLQPQPRQI
jgi:hypothetical protein